MSESFHAVPILRSFDAKKTEEFYIGFLGFKVDWTHRFEETGPSYTQISRAGMCLHISEHHGDTTPGTTVFVATKSLKEFHAEISAKDYNFNRPELAPAPWGGFVMETIDPFGNRLRFAEDIEE